MRWLYAELEYKRNSYSLARGVLDNPYSGPIERAWAEAEAAEQHHQAYMRRAKIVPPYRKVPHLREELGNV
jgi:hypothetical protein